METAVTADSIWSCSSITVDQVVGAKCHVGCIQVNA